MSPPPPKCDSVIIHFTRHDDQQFFNVGFFHAKHWYETFLKLVPEPNAEKIAQRWSSEYRGVKFNFRATEDKDGKPIPEKLVPCLLFMHI